MLNKNNQIYIKNKSSFFWARFSKLIFLLFIIFMIFGINIPFKEKIEDFEDIQTANPINRIVFSSLYAFSFICLLSKKHQAIEFIKTEKFLSLFLLWSFFSVFWSNYPYVSFKRWLQLFGMSLISLSVLLHVKSADDLVKYFKIPLVFYLPISILSVLFIPGAFDPEFNNAWRGLASSKNLLGQICLVSLIFWSYFVHHKHLKQGLIAMVFWCVSFILLIGSKSFTSILTGFLLVFFAGLFYLDRLVLRQLIGKIFSFIFLFSFCVSLLVILYFGWDSLDHTLGYFGKDSTLSGRTALWSLIFQETQKHLFAGCGYGGFWVASGTFMQTFFEDYYWIPNQAHLGYLDILNETGAIGIFLVLLLVIFYFRNLSKLGESHFWKWFVITTLVLNISESSLFKPHWFSFVMFNFSYIALHARLIHKSSGKLNGNIYMYASEAQHFRSTSQR